jgi:hypothetical protein
LFAASLILGVLFEGDAETVKREAGHTGIWRTAVDFPPKLADSLERSLT